MPRFEVGGVSFVGVQEGGVSIVTPSATGTKTCQIAIKLATSRSTMLGEWALSPVGPMHLNMIELDMADSSSRYDRHWTLRNAYVYDYEEIDPPPGFDRANNSAFYYQVFVRGTLLRGQDYNGTNILSVAISNDRPGSRFRRRYGRCKCPSSRSRLAA